ncbi:hypothetical protein [Campylobacter mucosalis]|uniref:hypothetical protein n=1 Tax=Campylobacter mucosalis TaxID=202 RepID=UPI0004DA8093|nr:hypothetical protein [Campylobacter mucosalis]KEA45191.1 hypothetical protein CR66_09375 [Campylobacter mucosalis]QKF63852.1 hypothetical protein CMCT_1755 [Campylobacter mucosalis]
MNIKNIILCLMVLSGLSGCSKYYIPTYETFVERVLKPKIGTSVIPKTNQNHREIYDENRYIYVMHYPKGCYYAYLTNRDDKPEIVQEWIILSGKENCKITESFVLLQ